MTDQEQVTIHLFGSSDDAGGSITKFHEALAVVTRDLGDAGIVFSQRRMNSDGIGVPGYALGLLTIPLVQFASPAAGNVLTAWISSRRGRKLKLKVGDVEVKAKSQADIDLLLSRALALNVQRASPDDAP